MNRTLVCDLEKFLPLFFIERSLKVNLAFDPIDLSFPCFTVSTISRVDLRMSKIYGYAFERQFPCAGVKRYRHRRAGTKCS